MLPVTTNAAAVFDEIRAKNKMKSDAELARKLDVHPPMVCAMRNKRIPLGNAMVERIVSGGFMSQRRLKQLLES